MQCQNVKKLFLLHLSGDLGKKKEEELLAHIRSCAKCREETEFVSKVLGNISAPDPIEPSPYFLSRTKAKIKTAEERFVLFPTQWRLSPVSAGLFAAAALVPLLAGIFLGNAYLSQTANLTLSSSGKAKTVLGLDAFDESPPGSFGYIYNKTTGGA